MKKLALTLAIVLTMGLGAFAQYDDGSLLGKSGILNGYRDDPTTPLIPNLPPEHGEDDDYDGPVGSGIAVLLGLGAAYFVAKKRKEE